MGKCREGRVMTALVGQGSRLRKLLQAGGSAELKIQTLNANKRFRSWGQLNDEGPTQTNLTRIVLVSMQLQDRRQAVLGFRRASKRLLRRA